MVEITLVSFGQRPLQPLLQEAIHNELRLVQAGLHRTEQRLRAFEARYNLPTAEFLKRYENDEQQETLDLAEWIGEYRLAERLREKIKILQEIRFAN